MGAGARTELAERIAGEVAMSEDPGGTLRKWRTDFEIAQSELADQLDVSPSVVSDYESGRRDNPGIRVVQRVIDGLLDIDEARGGSYIRQHARVLSAGFDADVVLDLREYAANVGLDRFYEAIGATELVRGEWDTVAGHTVIDSIRAITRLTSEEFYQLYGQSTNRALVFTNVTRGESPLVALRVALPTPNAVLLHGIDESDVWDHAADLARIEGCSVAVTTTPLEEMLEGMRDLP
jgi:putative transcriptional regulator